MIYNGKIRKLLSGAAILLILICTAELLGQSEGKLLTACQHLRRVESRRAKALTDSSQTVRVPKCSKLGGFEPIQCSNEVNNSDCWCVDEYGVEIVGTRRESESKINCTAVANDCPSSSCRMYCNAGFARDSRSGCTICQCRDPCEGIKCPGSLSCQAQEVQCASEPCPPVPTCKRARSIDEFCPVGQPLSITGTNRPFLCGTDNPGKPTCPPLFKCLVQPGHDYGVCCPASLKIQKPGQCPNFETQNSSPQVGVMCGTPCSHDLECTQMQKCCETSGCGMNCRQPFNVTACHQARMLSELLSVNEREGRGYIPQCDDNNPNGPFATRQCSRNGLVCWCVNPMTGDKIKGSMGVAELVHCEHDRTPTSGRSVEGTSSVVPLHQGCDQNICAAVCEYGFKNDHNGCPTCECSDPCDGYQCPMGTICENAKDPECISGSSLCASEPVCKPNVAYSNPCENGTPLSDNSTGEVFYCRLDSIDKDEFRSKYFFDVDEEVSGRSMQNFVACPRDYKCRKMHGESKNVCCPQPNIGRSNKQTDPLDYDMANVGLEIDEERQQTMCEYLRSFEERMEGTEEGMKLALPMPTCDNKGNYNPRQCYTKKVYITLEEQKQMESLSQRRQKRSQAPDEKIQLVSLQQASESLRNLQDMNIRNLVEYFRHQILDPITHTAELSFADMILKSKSESRSAKVIDFSGSQALNSFEKFYKPNFETVSKKKDQLVETEVEICWCVDSFGSEIPNTIGANTTEQYCLSLRDNLECLDITCRMGCDYGFVLDPETRCPRCQCRDPCDNVSCPYNQECRTVDVSCEGEYCPPVPACLPRKPGQCPFLIPPGNEESDLDACDYECRSDSHCEGTKRCCSNGCGTQCVEPQLKTACQHLQSIQIHQAIELGVPARKKYITQCDENTGSYKPIQCGPENECWCVDEFGIEKTGTRTNSTLNPDCNVQPKTECPMMKCIPCEHGYLFDDNGCRTCTCRDPCLDITCPGVEKCELVQIECIDLPCPLMPICLPPVEDSCVALKHNGKDVTCGPQSDLNVCPSTHFCQISPVIHRGVCCAKDRDACFEVLENRCTNKTLIANEVVVGRWTFSSRLNKCVPIKVAVACSSKNLFHTEDACHGVCPVLSQCERLRLKNELAAKRSGHSSSLSWFHPQCDPDTGNWLPVQCLGASGDTLSEQSKITGVCWCADKKGAPLKGSLTRNKEPVCNHRQARGRMNMDMDLQDPIIEELIRQMTIMIDENVISRGDDELPDEFDYLPSESVARHATRLEDESDNSMEISPVKPVAVENIQEKEKFKSTLKLMASSTRCNALKLTASFPVACDEYGAFKSMQCNGQICWCVDAAGNQLTMSGTFARGAETCEFTAIDLVSIELHMKNPEGVEFPNIFDIVRAELTELLKETPQSLAVDEMHDHIIIKFDLVSPNKIDEAFALEEMAKHNSLILVNGNLRPDITLSRFIHKSGSSNAMKSDDLTQQRQTSAIPESTFQTIVFVLATGSAFLVSIFVIFVMLKRGGGSSTRQKDKNITMGKVMEMGDKHLDFSSPIFVLSAQESLPVATNNSTSDSR